MAVKSRKKAKKTKAKRKPAKAAKKTKAAKAAKTKRKPAKAKAVRTVKAKTKSKAKRKPVGVVKTVKKAAKRLVVAAKRAVSPKKKKDVIGEGNYIAARNFRKEETSFIDNNRDTIAAKAKEAEAAIDGPEGAELERAREETAARGQE